MFDTYKSLYNEKSNFYRYCQSHVRANAHFIALVQRGRLNNEQYDIQNAVQMMYFWNTRAETFLYGVNVGNWLWHIRNMLTDVKHAITYRLPL